MEAYKRKMYTYADYEKLPQRPAYQLIDGDLVMTPAPTPYHQIILGRMHLTITEFVHFNKLGTVFLSPIDVYLSDTETYQPDIIYISNQRRLLIGEKKIEGAPDLVVEILSPGTGYYDLTHKRNVYQTSGVTEYWIVDPQEKTIMVFENGGGEFRVASEVRKEGKAASTLLSGFMVDAGMLFRPIGE